MNVIKFISIKTARLVVPVFLTVILGCGNDDGSPAPRTGAVATTTVATWTQSPQDYNENLTALGLPLPTTTNFTNQTVREIVHLGVGGDALRLKLSNRFGTLATVVDKIRIARSVGGASIDTTTDTAVTFAGAATVTIPAGGEVLSDAINFHVDQRANLAVSMYFANTPITTFHLSALATNYVNAGDVTSAVSNSTQAASRSTSNFVLSEIDVVRTTPTNVVVAFGDSITDGYASTIDANARYPDQLFNRVNPTSVPSGTVSIVNEGISGNRWIYDLVGPKGSGRFAKDALGIAGVTHVIAYLGINDIGLEALFPAQAVSAQQIIDAIGGAVTAAKAAKVKIYLATLTPDGALTPAQEAKRQAVNAFVRSQTSADGFIDFDAALRDPANPSKLLAAYDSGDHLHPNDSGYGALAAAINPALFQ